MRTEWFAVLRDYRMTVTTSAEGYGMPTAS